MNIATASTSAASTSKGFGGQRAGYGRGRPRPLERENGGPGNRNPRAVRIPPISQLGQSSAELTEDDAELIFDDFYGYVEKADSKPIFSEDYRPKFPVHIVMKEDRHYFIEDVGEKQQLLTPDSTIPVQIVCVDTEDILHLRYYEEENAYKHARDLKPKSVQKLLDEMYYYYEKEENKKATNYKTNERVPVEGEVVVVAIQRYFYWESIVDHKCQDFVFKDEFQRAKVLEVKSEGVTVELLDDHGSGGILMENVYRIKPVFVKISPQVFQCELAGMEFFQWKKLVQKAIVNSLIPNTDPDYTMNKVRVTFHGKYSARGLPLVDVYLRQSLTSKWLSLKSHVLKNMQFSLSPFNNLLEESALCRILRADSHANIWILCRKDSEILTRMNIAMEKRLPLYKLQRRLMRLTVEKILPQQNEERAKRNSQQLYVARLYDRILKRDLFYRVKIIMSKRVASPKLVHIFCIDYGLERIVPAKLLQPLFTFCRDFCFIPPLAFKVRLHRIGSLIPKKDSVISKLFHEGELKAKLVYEWPSSAYPPDVNLYHIAALESDPEADAEALKEKSKVDGLGKLLVENNCATEYDNETLKSMIDAAEEYGSMEQKLKQQMQESR